MRDGHPHPHQPKDPRLVRSTSSYQSAHCTFVRVIGVEFQAVFIEKESSHDFEFELSKPGTFLKKYLISISTLLKMGSYSSTTMCQYWDNCLIYWAVY